MEEQSKRDEAKQSMMPNMDKAAVLLVKKNGEELQVIMFKEDLDDLTFGEAALDRRMIEVVPFEYAVYGAVKYPFMKPKFKRVDIDSKAFLKSKFISVYDVGPENTFFIQAEQIDEVIELDYPIVGNELTADIMGMLEIKRLYNQTWE